MPSIQTSDDDSTMFDVELSPLSPSTEEQMQNHNHYPAANATREQQTRPLIGGPDAFVPAQSQSPENQSAHPDGQVLKVSRLAALGQMTVIMLSVTTVIIVAIMVLLGYLWARQNNTAAAGRLWRLIVVGSWLPQVITLCTLVLRWATAVQLCIFTSMLASVAVETFQVSLSQIVAVSVMRATNAKPAELLWALLQGNRYLLWGIRTIALTTALLLLQISFQFSSTILLSDLHPGQVRGNARPQVVRYGLSEALQMELSSDSMANPWTFKPPFWPSFAEYAEPAVTAQGLTDTGFTLRAFLPFETAQERQTIGNYSGVATIVPARVACFRPPLSNLTINIEPGEVSAGFVTGTIDFGEVRFDLLGGCKRMPCREMSEPMQNFNCTLNYGTQSMEWATTLCVVQDTLGKYEFSRTSSPYFGTGYLLLNVTGSVDEWFFGGRQNNGSWTNVTTLPSDAEWTNLAMPFDGGQVSATLCYYNQGPLNYFEVNASRTAPGAREPRFEWDAARGRYDTAAVLHQLGVRQPSSTTTTTTHQDRGILTLSSWRELLDRPGGSSSVNPFEQQRSNGSSSSHTLCQRCVRGPASSTHRTLTTLFQHALAAAAGDPAPALQALLTTVAQMGYHSLLDEFDRARESSVAPFVAVSLPRRWTGFGVVAALVAAHFVCGALVVALFLGECRCSMLGQLWRCVAQIRSGDTDVVLKKASVATDDDIRLWLKEHGKGETRVGVLPWRRRRGGSA